MAEGDVTRTLIAILYADVADYSRLTGEDELGTHRRLGAALDLISNDITARGGEVVHYAGDAVLAKFGSVVSAVESGLSIQRKLAESNADLPRDCKLLFRIGVNLGEVIVDRDDIYGDGVNIAARLESLAEPGGICVSASVHDQVEGKVEVDFEHLGERDVKNISKPVDAYRVVLDQLDRAPRGEGPPLPDKPSIAVLPFDNLSGDPDQDYFADGIVEEITAALSRVRSFFVIARNSSFTYKGRAVDVKQVSRELGVHYVIEGSMRKSGDRIRITAQLIDAVSGTHVWADRCDGVLEDIFALQDSVTECIIGAIEPRLRTAEILRSRRKPSDSLTAYDCFLRASPHVHAMTAGDNREAERLLRKAIDIDPNYASAMALLSWCLTLMRITSGSSSPKSSTRTWTGASSASSAPSTSFTGSRSREPPRPRSANCRSFGTRMAARRSTSRSWSTSTAASSTEATPSSSMKRRAGG